MLNACNGAVYGSFTAGCSGGISQTQEMEDDDMTAGETGKRDRAAILATLDEYAAAYCAKDIDRMMNLFDPGDEISVIGTGADELCSGRSAVRQLFVRNFAEATALQFRWGWRHLTVLDDFAMLAQLVELQIRVDGDVRIIPLRWTIGLVCRADGWRWLHRNASVAAGGQSDDQAYPDTGA